MTHGRYDDFDARYLPGGEIVFLSTRKGRVPAESKANTAATIDGRSARQLRPLRRRQLSAGAGLHAARHGRRGRRHLQPISAFENFEWTPAVADDGRILYTRWDYIDRFNGNFFSLWSTNPDGTNPQLVYGNYTVRPQVKFEARSIPGSHEADAHGRGASLDHRRLAGPAGSQPRHGGDAPIVRLTPEVPFPETEATVRCYYANP